MELSVHRVTDIKLTREQYKNFNTVIVTVTDMDGTETEVRLFSNEDNPIQIGEDK